MVGGRGGSRPQTEAKRLLPTANSGTETATDRKPLRTATATTRRSVSGLGPRRLHFRGRGYDRSGAAARHISDEARRDGPTRLGVASTPGGAAVCRSPVVPVT